MDVTNVFLLHGLKVEDPTTVLHSFVDKMFVDKMFVDKMHKLFQ